MGTVRFSSYPDGDTNKATCSYSATAFNNRTNVLNLYTGTGSGTTKIKGLFKGDIQIWPEIQTLYFKDMKIDTVNTRITSNLSMGTIRWGINGPFGDWTTYPPAGSNLKPYINLYTPGGPDVTFSGNSSTTTYYIKSGTYPQTILSTYVYTYNVSTKQFDTKVTTLSSLGFSSSTTQVNIDKGAIKPTWVSNESTTYEHNLHVNETLGGFCYLKNFSSGSTKWVKLLWSPGFHAQAYTINGDPPNANGDNWSGYWLAPGLPEKPENCTLSRESPNVSFTSSNSNASMNGGTLNGVSNAVVFKNYNSKSFGFNAQWQSQYIPYTNNHVSYLLKIPDLGNIQKFRYIFNRCSWNESLPPSYSSTVSTYIESWRIIRGSGHTTQVTYSTDPLKYNVGIAYCPTYMGPNYGAYHIDFKNYWLNKNIVWSGFIIKPNNATPTEQFSYAAHIFYGPASDPDAGRVILHNNITLNGTPHGNNSTVAKWSNDASTTDSNSFNMDFTNTENVNYTVIKSLNLANICKSSIEPINKSYRDEWFFVDYSFTLRLYALSDNHRFDYQMDHFDSDGWIAVDVYLACLDSNGNEIGQAGTTVKRYCIRRSGSSAKPYRYWEGTFLSVSDDKDGWSTGHGWGVYYDFSLSGSLYIIPQSGCYYNANKVELRVRYSSIDDTLFYWAVTFAGHWNKKARMEILNSSLNIKLNNHTWTQINLGKYDTLTYVNQEHHSMPHYLITGTTHTPPNWNYDVTGCNITSSLDSANIFTVSKAISFNTCYYNTNNANGVKIYAGAFYQSIYGQGNNAIYLTSGWPMFVSGFNVLTQEAPTSIFDEKPGLRLRNFYSSVTRNWNFR